MPVFPKDEYLQSATQGHVLGILRALCKYLEDFCS